MTVPDLSDLMRRVREAQGPDDELIGAVLCALDGVEFGSASIECGDDGSDALEVYSASDEHVWSSYRHLAPDASVDAALALVERKLPGANCWGIERDPLGCDGYVSRNNVKVEPGSHWLVEARAATPALAIIAALLTALSEQSK